LVRKLLAVKKNRDVVDTQLHVKTNMGMFTSHDL
jgi:hypothetical protein